MMESGCEETEKKMKDAHEIPNGVTLIIGDNNVRGSLQFLQHPNGTTHVTRRITGLSPRFHGFHIHAFGDTTNGCNSTGSLFSSSLFTVPLPPTFYNKINGKVYNCKFGRLRKKS